MPDNAIAAANVEYILPLNEIGPVLTRLCMNDNASLPISSAPTVSELSHQACPECGGVMKATRYGGLVEYGCHVGHRLGTQTMIMQKSDVIEKSLWNAVCQTEELLDLLIRERPETPAAKEAIEAEIQQRREEIVTLRSILQKERSGSFAA